MLNRSDLDMTKSSSTAQATTYANIARDLGIIHESQWNEHYLVARQATFGEVSESIEKLLAYKADFKNRATKTQHVKLRELENELELPADQRERRIGLTKVRADFLIKAYLRTKRNREAEVKALTDSHLARVEARELELSQYEEKPGPSMVAGFVDLIESDDELARLLNG